jgi:tetratricopeptide (TPR) repeat protein
LTKIVHGGNPDGPVEASALFAKANEAYDRGEHMLAIELLDEAIAKGLSSIVALNNKGAALDAIGRRLEAAECYRSAISESRSYELAWHNLGNCLFAQERYWKASRAYSKAHRLNPDRAENLIGLAESYNEIGLRRRARMATQKITVPTGDDRSLWLIKADLYVAARDGASAVASCKWYIASNPDDSIGYVHLGGVRHELGEYEEAIASFEKALKLSPNDPQIWNNFGYSCFCAGQADRALAAFDRAIEISPEYKHAWYNKGYCLHGVDRLKEAVKCYMKALEIDAVDPVLLNNLGNALYNLGHYAESIPRFVDAINVDPDYEIAWNNIGNALEKMGRYGDAIPFHNRSLEIRPDFDYALYAKGVCKAAVGEPEEGYELLLESLDINPTYEEAWKARSSVARQLGRMDDALSSIDNALAVNPLLCDGWLDRGDLLLEMGDGAGAHESFSKALGCAEELRSRYANDGDPWHIRAIALIRLGRHTEALDSAVRAVISRHPDTSALPLALEICRVYDVPEPPPELTEAVERHGGIDFVLPYAAFLAHRGDWNGVVSRLSAFASEDLTATGRTMLVRALVRARGRDAASVLMAGCPPEERRRLAAEVAYTNGDWEEAVEGLRAVLDESPGDHAAAKCLANALLGLDRFEEALDAAMVASGIDRNDWEPFEIMVRAFEALGKAKNADAVRVRAEELKERCGAEPAGRRFAG